MADEILGVLQTLYNHRELVRDACIEHSGTVPNTETHQAAVRALKKHGLLWAMGSSDDLTLARPLVHLLRKAQQRSKRLSAGDVERLWQELVERIEDFNQLVARGRTADLDAVEDDIRDGLYDLADVVSEQIRAFADYIDHGYAYVKDLDLRVTQNERAIARAKQLNLYLQSLNIHETVNQSRLNSRLRVLILSNFTAAIADSRRELINTLHRLNELLVTLRKDSSLSHLLRIMEVTFKNRPDFQPQLPPILDPIPHSLNTAAPLIKPLLSGSGTETQWRPVPGDIFSPVEALTLANSVEKRHSPSIEPAESTAAVSEVQDLRGETQTGEPEHTVVAAARALVMALRDLKTALSLRQAQHQLSVNCATSLWLTTVINVIDALPEHQRQRYELQYQETTDECYSGNHWVWDIAVRYLTA